MDSKSDIEALNRIMNRLVLVPNDKLTEILDKLLPKLIMKLDSSDKDVKLRVVDILNHICSRVRHEGCIKLPCVDLLNTCMKWDANGFTRNFANVFLNIGLPRSTESEKQSIAAALMLNVSLFERFSVAQNSRFQLLATILEYIPMKPLNIAENGLPIVLTQADNIEIINFFSDIAMYTGESRQNEANVLAGFSEASLTRLEPLRKLSSSEFKDIKFSMIRALNSSLFSTEMKVIPAVLATCDFHHEIIDSASELLRSLISSEKQGIYVNSSYISTFLFSLILGDKNRLPSSDSVTIRALNFLLTECPAGILKSVPQAIKVVQKNLLNIEEMNEKSDHTNAIRVISGTAHLAAFLSSRCTPENLVELSPILLNAALYILKSTSIFEALKPGVLAGTKLALKKEYYIVLEQCYEVISSIATGFSQVEVGIIDNMDLVRVLFSDLNSREPELRVKISAALAAVRQAYKKCMNKLELDRNKDLWELLWEAARGEDRSRLCAIDWAVDLYSFSCPGARYLCASLSNDKITAVRQAALSGLKCSKIEEYPSFDAFVRYAFNSEQSRIHMGAFELSELDPLSLGNTLDFTSICLSNLQPEIHLSDAYDEKEQFLVSLNVYLSCLEHVLSTENLTSSLDTLNTTGPVQKLHLAAAICMKKLLSMEFDLVDHIKRKFSSRIQWLLVWLGHESSTDIRENFAKISGFLAPYMDTDTQLVPFLRGLHNKMKNFSPTSLDNRSVVMVHGAILATGEVFAKLAQFSCVSWLTLRTGIISTIMAHIVSFIGHQISMLHTDSCSAICKIAEFSEIPLPFTSAYSTQSANDIGSLHVLFEKMWSSCVLDSGVQDSKMRAESAIEAIGWACFSLSRPIFNGTNHSNPDLFLTESSILREKSFEKLLAFSKFQNCDELQFAIGRSISKILLSGPIVLNESNLKDLNSSVNLCKIGEFTDSEKLKTVVSCFDYVVRRILLVLINDNSPHVVGASVIYLLNIVCEHGDNEKMSEYLLLIQGKFLEMLGARNEFLQEVAGRGLSAVFEAARNDSTRKALVEALVRYLGGGRKKSIAMVGIQVGMEVQNSAPTPSPLDSTTMGAYGEMCAIACDINRPELVYAFLKNAGVHPIWATFRDKLRLPELGGLNKDNLTSDPFVNIGPYVGKLLPRLYRYRFDGNPKTRICMEQLWKSLVKGVSDGDDGITEQTVINSYFDSIVQQLLQAANDCRWRDRQSACIALAELLSGRDWSQIGTYLEELWTTASRTMDDMRESVAVAANDYATTLANVSVRMCESSDDMNKKEEANMAVTLLLDWLLNTGIMSRCVSVQAISLKTIQRIISCAEVETLRPHLAKLIATLVEGMSALEPQALQYMQFHAEKELGISNEKMERLRISAAKTSPLQEALDRCCRHLNEESALGLLPSLISLLKGGVGLATRSAAACVVISLCSDTPEAVRASAKMLLQALSNASITETSVTVQETYTSALAAVARISPHALVAPLIHRLCNLFIMANEDLDSKQRSASALLIRDVAVRASESMGGDNLTVKWHDSAWAIVLPLAFVAQYDSDKTIAEAFQSVWTEGLTQLQLGCSGTPIKSLLDACSLMMSPIKNQIIEGLRGVSRGGRLRSSRACLTLAEQVSSPLASSGYGIEVILSLMSAIRGKSWEQKDALLEALVAVTICCKNHCEIQSYPHENSSNFYSIQCDSNEGNQPRNEDDKLATTLPFYDIVQLMCRQLERDDKTLRRASAKSLARLLGAYSDRNVFVMVSTHLLHAAKIPSLPCSSDVRVHTYTDEEVNQDPILQARAIEALISAWLARMCPNKPHFQYSECILDEIISSLPKRVWSVRVQLLKMIQAIICTVRENPIEISRNVIGRLISVVVSSAGCKDLKYTTVRVSAMEIILSLVSVNQTSSLAASIMPCKEMIIEASKRAADDVDSEVESLGKKALQMFSWWP